MKRNTLFQQKEATITCEENLGDVFYRKLLEPSRKKILINETKKNKNHLWMLPQNGTFQGAVSLEPK
jgi:hypothetical protein